MWLSPHDSRWGKPSSRRESVLQQQWPYFMQTTWKTREKKKNRTCNWLSFPTMACTGKTRAVCFKALCASMGSKHEKTQPRPREAYNRTGKMKNENRRQQELGTTNSEVEFREKSHHTGWLMPAARNRGWGRTWAEGGGAASTGQVTWASSLLPRTLLLSIVSLRTLNTLWFPSSLPPNLPCPSFFHLFIVCLSH